ncbi:MAG: type II toxin-antitoxin system Phd/YefM family antitoxin [Planctomycetes bacterium]|nr:type II toxin-antitoxin system Phd/YefM family antitoxin [Planctomycetota bacterium]
MRSVGLKVLKNKLSEYVRLVAAGETVLVTDRDVVVAELIPPREGRASRVDDVHLAELVRTGVVEPPALLTSGPPPRQPVAPSTEILEGLDRDRADR